MIPSEKGVSPLFAATRIALVNQSELLSRWRIFIYLHKILTLSSYASTSSWVEINLQTFHVMKTDQCAINTRQRYEGGGSIDISKGTCGGHNANKNSGQ